MSLEFQGFARVLLAWFTLSCLAAMVWVTASLLASSRERKSQAHIRDCDFCQAMRGQR